MNRNAIIAAASAYARDGALAGDLKRLVAHRSISQSEGTPEALMNYLADEMVPMLAALGYESGIFANPRENGAPLLIASRIEGDDLPTVLTYGHGDVCNGEASRWRKGLEPFSLIIEGDKLFGRGTADNKIQHLINIKALEHVIKGRGSLGFNSKIVIEMAEETGSYGLREFFAQQKEALAADVLIASDGPRLTVDTPTMFMGSRGGLPFDLVVNLRDGDYHSGNFGGLLADPVIILSHAIASIVDARGQIQVPEWRPTSLTDDIRLALKDLPPRRHDLDWGETDLTPSERVFGWNSLAVLAISSGNIAAPQNAIAGSAQARCQLRFVVGTDIDDIVPALRRHLDAHGFSMVEVREAKEEPFKATRFPPDHPWVRFVERSIAASSGKSPHVLPNLAGSLPNDAFTDILGLPTIWIPHSHAECGQHGPNEHALLSIAEEGMRVMTALFLDIADNGGKADAIA
ncbi:Acetylornithine deacetylase/Succinyl-diaminopimelate desuccinylase [Rhizobium mongolense subsp. loessense]|uniref:Acetylornithine deacetylase/Succinyl-diaminopimelate desuccinylase n=1 Tax=Rhizobium mongolense subsp. loessense TaxID=158890 RepID=A0A1G4S9Y6_9HYPH|nr:M20 family metallopeptidase [Rhizobium mongolense]SCW65811.1 Acetylornithine deacetylase/Succinyl-diaminopimelate desuccinylase [Rhizobium mongolense subsp. loessense]